MLQTLTVSNKLDRDGNPAGGEAFGTGLIIRWQDGPLGRGPERSEPNGAFVETVIDAALQRLSFYETASGGRFACAENAEAIAHLRCALACLEARTAAREARGVEGTHEA